jgi:MFS transporter, DHA1 family, quinolone resistance protein
LRRPGLLSVYILNQSFHWFIVGLMFPLLMLFILDRGLDIFLAGTMIALYSGTVIVLELPTGGLADSIGRKRTYIVSQAVYIMALTVLLVHAGIVTVIAGMVLMGTARALSSGSIDAWFVDEFKAERPKDDLQKALAKANIVIPVGIASGSLIGGLIPMYLGEWGQGSFGMGLYDMNLVVMILAVLVQITMTQSLVTEHRNAPHAGAMTGLKSLPNVVSTSVRYGIRNRTVLMLLLATAALGFSLMSLETYWQPRLSDIVGGDANTWIFGVIAAAYFISGSIGNLLSIPICSRSGGRYGPVLLGVRMLMAAMLMALAFQDTLLGFAAFYLMFYLASGLETSPFTTVYNNEVPSESRSTMLSMQSLVLQIGGLIGTFSLGYVSKEFSIGTAWTIASIVLFFSGLAYLAIHLKAGDQKGSPGPC